MSRIYIVEDDEDIRELVAYALQASGFQVRTFETARLFFDALGAGELPALALLDIMMPDEDGLTALGRLRAHAAWQHIPVIMVTAKGSEFDKVKALDMGADDYVVKPFGVTELISRIRAVLRRTGNTAPAQEDVLRLGSIAMDVPKRRVLEGGREVMLTYKEFELLYFLMRNRDLVMARDQILESVWGFEYEGETRTVDMHIKTLRQKLGDAGALIQTVRGVGYKIGEDGA